MLIGLVEEVNHPHSRNHVSLAHLAGFDVGVIADKAVHRAGDIKNRALNPERFDNGERILNAVSAGFTIRHQHSHNVFGTESFLRKIRSHGGIDPAGKSDDNFTNAEAGGFVVDKVNQDLNQVPVHRYLEWIMSFRRASCNGFIVSGFQSYVLFKTTWQLVPVISWRPGKQSCGLYQTGDRGTFPVFYRLPRRRSFPVSYPCTSGGFCNHVWLFRLITCISLDYCTFHRQSAHLMGYRSLS